MVTDFLLGVALVWLLSGWITAVVMRRRGHDFFVWFTLGSVLGPLVVALAFERIRYQQVVDDDMPRSRRPGSLDLLVGFDGSEPSKQALESAMAVFGSQMTSVTLATVLDYDAQGSHTGQEDRTAAMEALESVAASIEHPDARLEILFGVPDRALSEFAKMNSIEVIVVGPKGKGASERLFGSVAGKLVANSEVPVFVGRPVRSLLPYMSPD